MANSTFNLSLLNGTNGFAINGINFGDQSGRSVSSAGDINGDGIDDLIIGALGADPNDDRSGQSYVVFGSRSGFSSSLNLSTLNGINGFTINGISRDNLLGYSVSSAGDINGDGIDDLIVAAPSGLPGNRSGHSYVVFGSRSGFSSTFNLSLLNGINGFAINGVDEGEASGSSVSNAGDINGDGIDDLIIGADSASPNGSESGRSYVVFGSRNRFSSSFNLSTLNGTNGFAINGINEDDQAGRSVSNAGDVNGDGIDDLIIGSYGADPSADRSGQSYVVFGSRSGFSSSLNLSTLNGTNGFAINGINTNDYSGFSVSNAGDINGDGIADLIIGAYYADPNNRDSGQSYVVFGSRSGFSSSLNLSTLNGTNGFAINGINADDYSGFSVSNAGDINGDGIDDLIIGAFRADPNGSNSGQSYVVFGSRNGFSSSLNLSTLNGTNGFAINGINAGDSSGRSVSSAGDINDDGIDDLIIGAPVADPNSRVGQSYVVFGNAAPKLDLNGSEGGFAINGINAGDYSGWSVSSAGDINGDGIDDLIIGAIGADPNGNDSGQSYVVFGRRSVFSSSLNLSTLNGTNGFAINGINAGDESGRSVSSAGDVNGDGIDDLIIGAHLADPNGSDSGQSYVVFGSRNGFSSSFNLSTLNGTNGFAINGINADDRSGGSVSSAGDVNGDGIDDLIVAAQYASPNGDRSGQSYVVFGRRSGFSSSLNLSTLNGTNGFAINGIDVIDQAGRSVSGAGDINGDGINDLIVGAAGANPNNRNNSGQSYVVFGRSSGFSSSLNLSTLNGTNGFAINGINTYDESGVVSNAGDINGDDIDDLIIGAFRAGPNGSNSGQSYVVFGSRNGFSSSLNFSTLNGTNGFTINGINANDYSGYSVSSAGDINGDGIDDLIIGRGVNPTPNVNDYGQSYVVFGSSNGFSSSLNLSTLNGTNGFAINGINEFDFPGWSVSSAGDINGDGINDLIIGAPFADPNGVALNASSGQSYVIFGRVGIGASGTIQLSQLSQENNTGIDFRTTFTGTAIAIVDTDLTLIDRNSANLAGATVTITNLLDGTAETLAATTTGTNITASYANGVLSLSGVDTVAQYQQVLRTVTYNNTTASPTATNRNITFVVNDGASSSNTSILATTTLAFPPVNNTPTNNVPTAQTVNEDTQTAINGISVNDVDGNIATTQLTVNNGTLNITLNGAIISAGANDSSTLTLSGTQAQINDTLSTLKYQGNFNFNGSDTLTIISTDSTGRADMDTLDVTIVSQEDEATGTLGIIGTVQEGATISADISSITDGDGTITASYQWQQLVGATWTNIASATVNTYAIPSDQTLVGQSIRVIATTIDVLGGTTDFISSGQTVANVEDEATGTLGIIGTVQEGATISADIASITDGDGTITASYQWQQLVGAAWTNITGATANTYAIPSDQTLVGQSIRVIATTTDVLGGTTDFISSGQTVANVEEEAIGTLSITGTVQEGATISADISSIIDGDGTITASYQWQQLVGATWTSIASATANTYAIPSDQTLVGQSIRVIATTTDVLGGTTDFISSVQTVANVEDEAIGTLGIIGTVQEGATISADIASITDGDGTIIASYQWQQLVGAAWTNIASATANTYAIPSDQTLVGQQIRVIATTTDVLGGTTDFISSSQTVANVEDEATGTLGIIGTVQEGATVSADISSIIDGDGTITASYQWQQLVGATWTNIASATANTYAIPSDQTLVGQSIRVIATTTDVLGGTTDFISSVQTVANVEDEAIGTLSITGTVQEGSTISADIASITDGDGTIIASYQWQQLVGAAWTNITGATANTYAIPSDQTLVGQSIRVIATTTDVLGGTTDFISSGQTVANVEEEAIGTLGIIGTVQEGATISADIASITDGDGTIIASYQWQQLVGAAWTNIASATANTYAIPSDQTLVGQQIRVIATTTDVLGGTTDFISSSQTVANVEDEATGTLGIIGTVQEGATVSADISSIIDGDGTITASYQWQQLVGATWTNIASATANTYAIPSDQTLVGQSIRVIATTTDVLGGTTDFISSVQTVANVEDEAIGTLSITGTVQEGSTISADIASITDGDGTIIASYQWQQLVGAAWTNITGATANTYAIPSDQTLVGQSIRVIATTTDVLGGTTDFISSGQTVANVEEEAIGTLSITGTVQEGSTISADIASITDGDGTIIASYQWQQLVGAAWTNITGATANTYAIPSDQTLVGQSIRVIATTTDVLGGTTDFISSGQTVANVEEEAIGTLGIIGTVQEGATISADIASITDGDGTIIASYQWQQLVGAAWTNIASATANTYAIPSDQTLVGQSIRVIATTIDVLGGTTDFISSGQTVANVEDEATGTLGIIGTVQEGATISADIASITDGDGTITASYQWQQLVGAAWTNITGATANTYAIPSDQTLVGQSIRVIATTIDVLGGTTDFISSGQTVANVEDEATGTLGIIGTVQEGATISADIASITDGDGTITASYQWQQLVGAAWTNITGATANTYAIPSDQTLVGQSIRVIATTTDVLGGTTDFISSGQTVANVEEEAIGTLGIIGTVQEGATISADISSITDGDGTITASYQWQQLVGATWTNIASATVNTYAIPSDQTLVGQSIRVIATTIDVLGGTTDFISSGQTVANVEDEATGTLGIIGTVQEGATISADIASITDGDGTITASYQWQQLVGAAWTNITGATANTYAIPSDQTLVGQSIRVIATTTDVLGGTTDFISSGQTVANVEEEAIGTLSITGTVQEGATISADISSIIDGDGTITASYQWQQLVGATWTSIASATANTYAIPSDQTLVGQSIRVIATTTDVLGGTTDFISSVQTVANVEDEAIGTLGIIGTVQEGATISADIASITDGDGTIIASYQWQQLVGAAWTNIASATANTYAIPSDQTLVGQSIRVIATTTDVLGGTTDFISSVQTVANVEDEAIGTLGIIGTVQEGATISADISSITDGDGTITASYQWQQLVGATWTNITGATANTYAIPSDQSLVGQSIRVIATTTDVLGGTTDFISSVQTVANVEDEAIGTLGIIGTVQEGATISADIASITDGDGTITASYQWQQLVGATWTNIASATANTYAIPSDQTLVGQSIRVIATTTDVLGGTTDFISSVQTVANVEDEAIGTLGIIGTVQEGATISADISSITDGDGTITASYQWQQLVGATWTNITGATANTYAIPSDQSLVGQSIRVIATTTDVLGGTTDFISSVQTVANVEDEAIGTLGIIGTVQEGATISADIASITDGDGTITASYQWQQLVGATWTNIASATANTYAIPSDQTLVGQSIRVIATTTDVLGGTTDFISSVQTVANVEDEAIGTLGIIGTVQEGATISADIASITDGDGTITASYQWQQLVGATWTNIASATANTYAIPSDQTLVGQSIRVIATTTDVLGGTTDFISSVQTVANVEDEAIGTLGIIGTVQEGATISADIASITDGDGTITASYQWQQLVGATWTNITGATANTYAIPSDQTLVGQSIRVIATTTDVLGGTTDFISSGQTVANVEEEAIGTLGIIGTVQEGATISADIASITDGDGTITASYQWQQLVGAAWTNITGATANTYAIPSDQTLVGQSIRVIATTTDVLGGTTDFISSGQTVANVEEEAIGTLSITGTVQEGSTISADIASITDGDGTITASYQWQQLVGATWTNIASATANTYAIPSDQTLVGQSIRVIATTIDVLGGTTDFISSGQTVANVEDEATGTLGIIGTVQEGATISADIASITDGDGTITASYQWQQLVGAAWTNITGATANTYAIPSDQTLVGQSIRVIATTTDVLGGTTDFISSGQTVANVEEEAIGTLSITGTVQEGATISADIASITDADGTIIATYQWQQLVGATWTNITGATNGSYAIPNDQSLVGQQIRVIATTTDALGGTTDFISSSQTVANVEDEATGTPSITGTIQEGTTISANIASITDADGTITATYQWQASADNGANWTNIAGATNSNYPIPSDQSLVGQQLRIIATTTDALGGTTEFISSSLTVANVADEAIGTLSITGTVQEGATISADIASITDADGTITATYQWQQLVGATWTNVTGATANTYAIPSNQNLVGQRFRVIATTTDALGGTTDFISSSQTVADVEEEAIGTLIITGVVQQGATISADISSITDTNGTITASYQWQQLIDATWTNITGATANTYVIPSDQTLVGQQVRVIATTTDTLGGTTDFVSSGQNLPRLVASPANILRIENGANIGTTLRFRKLEHQASLRNELSWFAVDDDNGTVNGLAPGQAGYQNAAIQRSQVVFAALSDNSVDLRLDGQIDRHINLGTSSRIGLLLVVGSSIDEVRQGTRADVLFTIPTANNNTSFSRIAQSGAVQQLAWEDTRIGGDGDFNELGVEISIAVGASIAIEQAPNIIGTEQQGTRDLVDLRSFTGQKTFDVRVSGDAAFRNTVGFYRVDDLDGNIDGLKVGDAGYLAAALRRNVVSGMKGDDLTVQLDGGSILAPFLVSNNSVENVLSGATTPVYFGNPIGNTDKLDHVRLLGDNKFAFEDLSGGGDRDFNDVIIQISARP